LTSLATRESIRTQGTLTGKVKARAMDYVGRLLRQCDMMEKLMERPLPPLRPPPPERAHVKIICDACGQEKYIYDGKVCDVKGHFVCSGCIESEEVILRKFDVDGINPPCPLCVQRKILYSELQ